jgi:hypothetical protein
MTAQHAATARRSAFSSRDLAQGRAVWPVLGGSLPSRSGGT